MLPAPNPLREPPSPIMAAEKDKSAVYGASQGRILGLDGIRGVGILAMITFHMTTTWKGSGALEEVYLGFLKMAWTTVELFFVFSGYLITDILLKNKDAPNYFTPFYARRMLRIVPLYYLVLLFYFVVVPAIPYFEQFQYFWIFPEEAKPWVYWVYVMNYYVASLGSFEHMALNVCWSLSIEEHYYLLWPLAVWVLPRRALLPWCAFVTIVSFAFRVHAHMNDVPGLSIYVTSHMRLDGLAIGSALAVLVQNPALHAPIVRWSYRLAPAMFVLTTAAIVYFHLTETEGLRHTHYFLAFHWFLQTVGVTMASVYYAACVAIITIGPPGNLLQRVFEHPALTILGKYCYSLYLLHTSVILFVRFFLFNSSHAPHSYLAAHLFFYCTALPLMFLLSHLAWICVEEPFLNLKRYFPYSYHKKPKAKAEPPAAPAPPAPA